MDECGKSEFTTLSDMKQQKCLVSSSTLMEREKDPDNEVINQSLSILNKTNENGNTGYRVAGYDTSSSNDLSLTVDKIHTNCLPPGYLVSIQPNLIIFIDVV